MDFLEYADLKAIGKVTLSKVPGGSIYADVDRGEHLEIDKAVLKAEIDKRQAELDILKTLKADIEALP